MNCKWFIIAFEGADSSDSKGSVSVCAAGCFRVVWPDPEDSKREVSMLKLQSVVTLACIGVVLGVHWFLTPQKTMAQAPNTLVIVTNAFDHELVRRVGDKVVQVEVLLHQRPIWTVPPMKFATIESRSYEAFDCFFSRKISIVRSKDSGGIACRRRIPKPKCIAYLNRAIEPNLKAEFND